MSDRDLNTGTDVDALAALSVSDLNPNVNHEPRLLDLRVAERLGYDRPRDVRKIIERYRAELETYGAVVVVEENSRHGGANSRRRGAPGRTYWLNEAQTLLICMFSKTHRAALVRKEVIDVYMAWRRGTVPHRPNPAADERNQRKAFALIGQLDRETRPDMRQFIYDMLVGTAQEMGLTPPPLSSIGREAAPAPDILIPFWRGIRGLEDEGIHLNHSHNPAIIALRMPEVREEFRKSQVRLPFSKMLYDALKDSRSPRFIAFKAVHSAILGKTVKCWVFEDLSASEAED